MKCEVCGREAHKLYRVRIEGVEMLVCNECKKFGEEIVEKKAPQHRVIKRKASIPYSKDIFQNMDKDLLPGWGEIIRKAREQAGMSRQELGEKIGEKVNTVAKIENEELRPPDETVKRIEKVLRIKLFQEVKGGVVKKGEAKPLTLGDLLKKNE